MNDITFPLRREFCVNVENMNFKFIIDRVPDSHDTKSILSVTFHIHSHTELFACTKGEIIINTPNGAVKLCSGDIAVIPPNFTHTRLISNDESLNKWCSINFLCIKRQMKDVEDIYSAFEKMFCVNKVIVIRDRIDFCMEITKIINDVSHDETAFPALKVVNAMSNLLPAKSKSDNVVSAQNAETYMSDMDLLYKLNHIINSCFMNNYSNSQIADMLFISERQLSRIVAKYYGMSIRHVLTDRRLVSAEKLLTDTDNTVECIGAFVGYKSKSGFYRDFKNKYGITPAEYRKNKKI